MSLLPQGIWSAHNLWGAFKTYPLIGLGVFTALKSFPPPWIQPWILTDVFLRPTLNVTTQRCVSIFPAWMLSFRGMFWFVVALANVYIAGCFWSRKLWSPTWSLVSVLTVNNHWTVICWPLWDQLKCPQQSPFTKKHRDYHPWDIPANFNWTGHGSVKRSWLRGGLAFQGWLNLYHKAFIPLFIVTWIQEWLAKGCADLTTCGER